MNGRQPSITLGNKENEKIGFLNRDNNTRKSKKIFYNEEFDPGSG
jgi:hypothetical protein